jgi:hypothetical protein
MVMRHTILKRWRTLECFVMNMLAMAKQAFESKPNPRSAHYYLQQLILACSMGEITEEDLVVGMEQIKAWNKGRKR